MDLPLDGKLALVSDSTARIGYAIAHTRVDAAFPWTVRRSDAERVMALQADPAAACRGAG